MVSFFKEFKTFAVKGNVVDLAVGIIIGAAFNSVVKSIVDDLVMPPVGALINDVDFANLYINLSGEEYESLAVAQEAGAATINYGLFVNALISFILTAFAVFLLVKVINKMREEEKKNPAPTPNTRPCPFCYTEISKKAIKCPNCTSDIKQKTNSE